DGESGVREALSGRFAIAVLDVMMPRLNGVEVLRRIRAASRLPVLMLTARGDDIDRIIGLELGADDYVPKPCSPRELVARLRAILRRVADNSAESTSDGPIVVGPLRMWPERRSAQWQQQPLELTSTEFSILEVMARHAGRVVSKSDLSELAMGRPLARFDRSIDVHVSSIRQKLGARPDGDSWIQTVRGQGYQFVKA
ncbi:response regulator transcription factor, partial [Accumulibacter sp.]